MTLRDYYLKNLNTKPNGFKTGFKMFICFGMKIYYKSYRKIEKKTFNLGSFPNLGRVELRSRAGSEIHDDVHKRISSFVLTSPIVSCCRISDHKTDFI